VISLTAEGFVASERRGFDSRITLHMNEPAGDSFSGRTEDFESSDAGSIPASPTNIGRQRWRAVTLMRVSGQEPPPAAAAGIRV
jgi:hypothetical protein